MHHRAAAELDRINTDRGYLADRCDGLAVGIDGRCLTGAVCIQADIEVLHVFAAFRNFHLNVDVAAANLHRDITVGDIAFAFYFIGRAAVAVAGIGIAVMTAAEIRPVFTVRRILHGKAARTCVGNTQTEGHGKIGILRGRDLHLQVVLRRKLNDLSFLVHIGLAVFIQILRNRSAAHTGRFAAEIVVGRVGGGGGEARCDILIADVDRHDCLTVQAVIGIDKVAVDQQIARIVGVAAPGGDDSAVILHTAETGNRRCRIVFGNKNILKIISLRPSPVGRIVHLGRISCVAGADHAVNRDMVQLVAAAVLDDISLDGFVIGNHNTDNQIFALRSIGQRYDVAFHCAGNAQCSKFHPSFTNIGGVTQRQVLRSGGGRARLHLEGHIRTAGGIGDDLPISARCPAGLAQSLGNIGNISAANMRQGAPAAFRRLNRQRGSIFKLPAGNHFALDIRIDKAVVNVFLFRIVVRRIDGGGRVGSMRSGQLTRHIDHVDLAVAAAGNRCGCRFG